LNGKGPDPSSIGFSFRKRKPWKRKVPKFWAGPFEAFYKKASAKRRLPPSLNSIKIK